MQPSVKNGSSLIFLISQPRAGSTLTQKILGGHPRIHTVSEPWMMLHPLYAFREEGCKTNYNSRLAKVGVESFLSHLTGDSKQLYLESVAQMYGNFYQQAINSSGKEIFLDKTPRYYNIISELHQTFPQARFIVLLRNPLAVLCSIIHEWIQNRWLNLHWFKCDILDAPALLLSGIETLGESVTVVHYEKILKDFDCEMDRVCNQINVEFSHELRNYGQTESNRWAMGDKKNIYEKNTPESSNANRWIEKISNPQVWRLTSDYLDFLGAETMSKLGYDYTELRGCLDKRYPGRFRMWNTMPLRWLMKSQTEFTSLNYGFYPVRLANSIQQRGILGASAKAATKVMRHPFRK